MSARDHAAADLRSDTSSTPDALMSELIRVPLSGPPESKPARTLHPGGRGEELTDWTRLLKYYPGSPTSRPTPRRCLENVLTTLRHCPDWRGVLRYNEFADRVEFVGRLPSAENHEHERTPGPLRDEDSLWVAAWFNDKLGFEPSIDMIHRALGAIAQQNLWHPVREYLRGLQWDGIHRLDSMFVDLFGAEDNPVVRAIGAKWPISAVARIMGPGCQVDHILVLEGPQGIGKSSALRTLVGHDWFRNSPIDLRNKDAVMGLRGCWVYEFDELDSFRGREATRVKSFVSGRVDSYRPAYGRNVIDVPRGCVFAASTNEERYLVDATGNRRFWPVRCGKIDIRRLAAVRDQLWAEAYARYRAGEPWHVESPTLLREFRQEQEEREEIDPWIGLTREWLDGLSEDEAQRGVTTHQALAEGLQKNRAEARRADETRMGHVLKSLGCERRRVSHNGAREYRYFPPDQPDRASPQRAEVRHG